MQSAGTLCHSILITPTQLRPPSRQPPHHASPHTAEDQATTVGSQQHQEEAHPQGLATRQLSLYQTANMFQSLPV